VGVRPCVILFRYFFILVKSGRAKDEVGAYYFQTTSDPPTPYIPGLTGGKWDWVIATTEANECLALPTEGPATDRASWRAKPSLQPEFDSVLGKIRSLAESGLTSWHVLGDFLKRRIAPLKQAAAPCLELYRPQRLQQDPSRKLERPDPGSLGGPGAGGDGGRLHPGEPDPPSVHSPPLRGPREGGGAGYPANSGRRGTGPTPDWRRPESWAPDPWRVRGSICTERCGVRRHHEGEADRG